MVDFRGFLGGASGRGNSTSWERSRRERGTHSAKEVSWMGRGEETEILAV